MTTGCNDEHWSEPTPITPAEIFTSNISINLLLQDFRDGKVNVIPGDISSAPRSRRSSRGSSYQRSRGTRDLVQPWLARLRLVNCMLAMTHLCSENPLWFLERQQQLPADKQPASQGHRWGCMSGTLTNCACFCPYFIPLYVLHITSVNQ